MGPGTGRTASEYQEGTSSIRASDARAGHQHVELRQLETEEMQTDGMELEGVSPRNQGDGPQAMDFVDISDVILTDHEDSTAVASEMDDPKTKKKTASNSRLWRMI